MRNIEKHVENRTKNPLKNTSIKPPFDYHKWILHPPSKPLKWLPFGVNKCTSHGRFSELWLRQGSKIVRFSEDFQMEGGTWRLRIASIWKANGAFVPLGSLSCYQLLCMIRYNVMSKKESLMTQEQIIL